MVRACPPVRAGQSLMCLQAARTQRGCKRDFVTHSAPDMPRSDTPSSDTPSFDKPGADTLRLAAASPRAALVMIAEASGACYELPAPRRWALWAEGQRVDAGLAEAVPLLLEGLTPGAQYLLEVADAAPLAFTAPPCAGAVDPRDFGADPAAPDNAAAFARAIAAVPEGGSLVIPEGVWTTGPLRLKSDMVLHVPRGATLRGITDRSAIDILPAHGPDGRLLGSWEGLPEACYAALITAIDCDGLTIAGGGTIDGAGAEGDWWSWPKETRDGARRPRLIYALRCADLTLLGLTLRNAPSWTLHPLLCTRVQIAGLSIQNPPDSPNTDGLDPESCTDMTIEGVGFDVGDDCIAIKAGKRTDAGNGDHLAPCERLTIRHCRMQRGHGAVVIGSEMSGSVRDVAISHCTFSGTDRGLRIKTRRGRGGVVERVSLSECRMDDIGTAFCANAFYFCDHDGKSEAVQSRAPAPRGPLTPEIRAITVRDVSITGLRACAGAFLGLPEAPLGDVEITGIAIGWAGGAAPEVPVMACHVPAMTGRVLYTEFAELRGDLPGLAAAAEEENLTC